MAVGKQDENTIVKWFPGNADGVDGSGITTHSIPVDKVTTDVTAAVATEATARGLVNTRVSTLSARLVASGTLPAGV